MDLSIKSKLSEERVKTSGDNIATLVTTETEQSTESAKDSENVDLTRNHTAHGTESEIISIDLEDELEPVPNETHKPSNEAMNSCKKMNSVKENTKHDRSPNTVVSPENPNGLYNSNIMNYIMSLESERHIFITGATILAMKGLITLDEYHKGSFSNKNIRQEILEKKFYLNDILGAMRGITRLKLALCKDRLPSLNMFKRMKKEDEELLANGCEFVSDVECSYGGSSSTLPADCNRTAGPNSEQSESVPTYTPRKLSITLMSTMTKNRSSHLSNNTDKNLPNSVEDISLETSVVKNNDDISSSNQDVEDQEFLPDELHRCGNCGLSISSLQQLHRHLERCRGSKRKRSSNSLLTRKRVCQQSDDGGQPSGKLYVCDTENGEVIEGWGPPMGAVPPGPTCPRCLFEVPTLYDLPLHQRHHTRAEKIVCPVCTFSTTSIPHYLIHVEEHAS